jgi:hypothetical protein
MATWIVCRSTELGAIKGRFWYGKRAIAQAMLESRQRYIVEEEQSRKECSTYARPHAYAEPKGRKSPVLATETV